MLQKHTQELIHCVGAGISEGEDTELLTEAAGQIAFPWVRLVGLIQTLAVFLYCASGERSYIYLFVVQSAWSFYLFNNFKNSHVARGGSKVVV